VARRPRTTDHRPPRLEHVEQSHGLEKAEAMRLAQEGVAQTRVCSPARGGHECNGSSSGGMRATSWVNELIDA